MKHDRIEIWPEVPPAVSLSAFVGSLRKSWAGLCFFFAQPISMKQYASHCMVGLDLSQLRPVEAQRCRQVFWKLREVIPQVILFPVKKS